MRWIVQSNIFQEKGFNRLIEALDDRDALYEIVKVIPFTNELPSVKESDEPTIIYGTTTLMYNAYKQKKWSPGVFFDDKKYRPSYWINILAKNAFNHQGMHISVKEFLEFLEDYKNHNSFFIRSDDDSKMISGSVFTKEEFIDWWSSMAEIGDVNFPTEEYAIHVAPPQRTYIEWRFVVVNDQVITGSQYKTGRRYNPSKFIRPDVNKFAQEMANKLIGFSPAYMLDVCIGQDDELKVLELGCFNAAGFYDCDVNKIVEAIDELGEP
ncbi:ATP-grasp domain-containing protein [Candidatus Pacearchaeota archaeon]|nr:ATP-grasp domain-containing protein [Candidatus Pacearchaeota archaeon]